VGVVAPKDTQAMYSLSSPERKGTSLVLSSETRRRSPVARGSRVPVCPTRRVPRRFLASSTASWEVRWRGLSTA
jgi:hypothetical protein